MILYKKELIDKRLWCDVPDNKKSDWLRSGRAWETGVLAKSIVEDVARAYERAATAEARIKALEQELLLWQLNSSAAKRAHIALQREQYKDVDVAKLVKDRRKNNVKRN